MSKKTPIKKTKRRLKRTVRRSLAAVLMITAIGVAAIPVPENYAESGAGSAGTGYRSVEVPDKYAYGVTDTIVTHRPSELNSSDPDNDYSAYIITPLSDGTYQLDWQFKFFLKDVEGTERGIISKYNSTYQQDTVVLNPNVIYDYDKIETSVFDTFYQDCLSNGTEYTVSYEANQSPDLENPDDAFLNEYFNTAYQNYLQEWKNYVTEFQKWQNSSTATDDNKPKKPSLTKTPNDLLDDQKLKYYCDVNKSSTNRTESLKGCKLAYVIDSTYKDPANPTNPQNHYVYIPQRIEGKNPSGKFDSQDFKYTADSSIIGIGGSAFKDTKNVYYLTVPKEIKYIGTSAFENSFIKEIAFYNVQNISDFAFRNCSQLTKVSMGEGTTLIGTEAFYGSGLTSVEFPQSIEEIGPGAFAYCESLQKIDLSKITTSPAKIDDYAFYNDIALNEVNIMKASSPNVTVNINTIGDGAFAVSSGVVGSMKSFTFPSKISKAYDGDTGFGDCVLAGRTNLETVIMPADFGRTKPVDVKDVTIPDNTFYNCYNLACVEFPDDGSGSCGYASYNADKLFITISNPDFYVKGPETDSSKSIASPRKITRKAKTAVAPVNDKGKTVANVTYLYIKDGKKYYEISNGTYLMCIDNNGILTSCIEDPEGEKEDPIDNLLIPEKVGNTKVTGIASDCFSDDTMNQKVKRITIDDNSISIINDSVFKDWKKLQEVYIGNSVTTIGASAFEGCSNLIDVSFNTPTAGYDNFVIGKDAFKTGGDRLTFHGDIVEEYDPFEWAMDKNNFINEQDGIRVCYKSDVGKNPTYLSVMYDANTDMVTLLDYPKIEDITKYFDDEYNASMEAKYYEAYGGSEYDEFRKRFANEWNDTADSDVETLYDSLNYGPWINEDFCSNWQTYLASVDTEEKSMLAKAYDIFFEPLVVEAATSSPIAFYDKYPYKVLENEKYNDLYHSQTEEERAFLYAVKNIVVPAGVESIDVNGFKNSSQYNANNVRTYFSRTYLGNEVYDMYYAQNDDLSDSIAGLFSGDYVDKRTPDSNITETDSRGNDYIQSVTLNSVKYLPDYAFDSCENLQYVVLGKDCKDIGTAPFRGCTSLTTVGDNEYYKTDNGIVYSVNTDGSYTIEECLPARGNLVGGAQLSLSTDANLGNVSVIKDGAFEECKYINLIDLSDTAGLKDIPKNCFRNCEDLTRLSLPRSVNNIEEGAFAKDKKLVELTIPGTEVFISAQAFDEESADEKAWTTILTYADSSARRYADTYKDKYKLNYEQKKDEWRVIFLDSDLNQVGDAQYVEDNTFISDVPTCPAKDNWTFEKWLGTNNTEVTDRITSDTTFVAQGYSDNGMVNGKYTVAFYDQVDGTQIGTTQYVEPGQAAIAPQAPVHTGYTFLKWSSEEYTNVQKNLTIMAMYSGGSATTSGGSTTTSGGTTTTSGGTTSTSSSSSNTSSSTSSSSSNTSSSSNSSNTSGSNSTAGTYTVLVENGSGSGSYTAGSTVIIAANTPAEGMVFQKWTTESNGVNLASVSLPATTFVMPANNVTVTANYVAGNGATAATTGTGNGGSTTGNNGNTVVDITKPGISNKDLATANVNGSTDNFVIKISETDEATRAVAAALTNKYGSLDNILYYAMDITLYDSTGTTKITDTSGLSIDITIPIPDALVAYGGNNMAGAVINGDQLEELNESFTTINGVPCVRFTATHFSPYTIYVDTGNLTEGMLDVTPKTGDPIHPKWFLSIGLACLSIILFLKKDKKVKVKTA
ncbi:MAG: leucine-rich repeat protein [Lachnospiraceae bacterium]